MPKPKRNITAIAQETLTPPDALPPNHSIARLTSAAGNNLYHITLPDNTATLAELNAKFRSTIWLKRGSYVVVDTAALADRENKIGGEIVNIVGDEKAWRKMNWWPVEFNGRRGRDWEEGSEDEGPRMPSSEDEEEGEEEAG